MKKLYIFDFDGTLVDTITDVGICFNEALRCCGFPEHPLEKYIDFVGGNLETVISRLLPVDRCSEQDIDAVKTVYRKLYIGSEKPNTLPFPGIPQLLSHLIDKKILIAIHTNKAQALTDDLCRRFFGNIPFLSVIGYDPSHPSKPEPWGVAQMMRESGVRKEETVYIGDGLTDVLTAENAGVDCVYVTWGQGKSGDCNNPAVKQIVHSVAELLEYIKKNS